MGADIRLRTIVVDGDPQYRAGVWALPVDRGHPVLQRDLDTGFLGGNLEGAHQAIAGGPCLPDGRVGRFAGVRHRPMHHGGVHFPRQ